MIVEFRDGANVKLRAPKKSDLGEFWRFINELIDEDVQLDFNKRVPLAEERKWLDGVLSGIRKGDVIGIVADADGRIVGDCFVVREKKRHAHVGEIGVAVSKAWRGRGLGTALMKEAIKRAKGKFKILELGVFSTNKAAYKLYKELGFKRDAVLKKRIKYKGKYVDRIVMSRAP